MAVGRVAPAREGQIRQEGQSADTCEIDFTQHDDLLRFAHGNRRNYKCAYPRVRPRVAVTIKIYVIHRLSRA